MAENVEGEWKHGICSCCESIGDCLYAGFCPCCYVISVGEATGNDDCKQWGLITAITMLFIGNGIGQLPFVMVRNKIREMKGIQGSMVNDCLCVWCCSCCTMIQAKREFEEE